jgi:hypothetical protein
MKVRRQPASVTRTRRPPAQEASIAPLRPSQHGVTVKAYQRRACRRKFVHEADLLKEVGSAVGDDNRIGDATGNGRGFVLPLLAGLDSEAHTGGRARGVLGHIRVGLEQWPLLTRMFAAAGQSGWLGSGGI